MTMTLTDETNSQRRRVKVNEHTKRCMCEIYHQEGRGSKARIKPRPVHHTTPLGTIPRGPPSNVSHKGRPGKVRRPKTDPPLGLARCGAVVGTGKGGRGSGAHPAPGGGGFVRPIVGFLRVRWRLTLCLWWDFPWVPVVWSLVMVLL